MPATKVSDRLRRSSVPFSSAGNSHPDGQSSALALPLGLNGDAFLSRSSSPFGRHAQSSPRQGLLITPLEQLTGQHDTKQRKHRSWLPTLRKSPGPAASDAPQARAWIGGHQSKLGYNVASLANALPIAELWRDSGDMLVYLSPPTSGIGPSFKLHSSLIASSRLLTSLTRQSSTSSHHSYPMLAANACPTYEGIPNAGREDASPTGSDPVVLVLPFINAAPCAESSLTDVELNVLVTARNLFAFLLGQSLVCTEQCPSVFATFLRIAELLKTYEFTNMDGTTFGEVASHSFDRYVNELNLADVRGSREKTIEALVLAERMRSAMLYNEAFIHAAGKYASLQDLLNQSQAMAKFQMLSTSTKTRLERTAIDLDARKHNVRARLSGFDFPSIFAGIASSKSAEERKYISFDAWKHAFSAMRKQVLGYYRSQYGSWPPKSKQKGLGRLVLKRMNDDLAELYDLWVDRNALTSRTSDLKLDDSPQPAHRAIRGICDEYDRSVPPVQPPIPFDVPILPNLQFTRGDYGLDAKRDHAARNTKLSPPEIHLLLDTATNSDARDASQRSPFVAAMNDWERKQARGCTFNELCDLRCGAWIFLYVVLQSLPMLTVDAPGVRFHADVDYFLCVPPRSGMPWAGDRCGARRRNFYRVSGGDERVVSLPSDLIEHGVEGIYRRSHCWLMAAKWRLEPPFAETTSALQREHTNIPHPLSQSHVRFDADRFRSNSETSSAGLASSYQFDSPSFAPSPSRLSVDTYDPSIPSIGSRSSSYHAENPTRRHASTPDNMLSVHQRSSPYQSRSPSPAQAPRRNQQWDSVLTLGLEQLPIPVHMAAVATKYARDTSWTRRRQASSSNFPYSHEPTTVTFDDIISGMPGKQGSAAKQDSKTSGH